jgi:hypothetical protein
MLSEDNLSFMKNAYTPVSPALQEQLNRVAVQLADRKEEVVELLSDEQPSKSRLVEMSYVQCAWWEGCYYCQDENQQWHQVKCFR